MRKENTMQYRALKDAECIQEMCFFEFKQFENENKQSKVSGLKQKCL